MGYEFLVWTSGLDLECWGAGSLCTGFGGGNLGTEFCPGNRRGARLNEVIYGLF